LVIESPPSGDNSDATRSIPHKKGKLLPRAQPRACCRDRGRARSRPFHSCRDRQCYGTGTAKLTFGEFLSRDRGTVERFGFSSVERYRRTSTSSPTWPRPADGAIFSWETGLFLSVGRQTSSFDDQPPGHRSFGIGRGFPKPRTPSFSTSPGVFAHILSALSVTEGIAGRDRLSRP